MDERKEERSETGCEEKGAVMVGVWRGGGGTRWGVKGSAWGMGGGQW